MAATSRILGAWRATTDLDRAVAVLTFLGVTAALVVPRVMLWVDVEADNRTRWHYDFLGAQSLGLTSRGTVPLFVDASEEVLPPGFHYRIGKGRLVPAPFAVREGTKAAGSPTRRVDAAYLSVPERSRDRWGHRWVFVLSYQDEGDGHYHEGESVYSTGANGAFEWGEGDDVLVGPYGAYPKMRAWAFAILVGWGASCYMAIRVHKLPRSAADPVELFRASLTALPLVGVAYVLVHEADLERIFAPWGPMLVPARTAVFLSAAAAIFGVVLLGRLRRPLPDGRPRG
jgi:hypothetical protein